MDFDSYYNFCYPHAPVAEWARRAKRAGKSPAYIRFSRASPVSRKGNREGISLSDIIVPKASFRKYLIKKSEAVPSEEDFSFVYDPIKKEMRETISEIMFKTFIEVLKPVDIDGKVIVLECPGGMEQPITDTLADKIRDAIVKANVGLTDFRLRTAGTEDYTYNPPEETPNFESKVNKRFTFDSFVVGQSNEYGYSAALSVAEDPSGLYNPLFIYGATGLGKTHLIQAIANKVRSENPQLHVIYVTCEQYVNQLIDYIFTSRNREIGNQLRMYFRNADVLIIDDIQFLQGKQQVQVEFFNTFNELVDHGKQIVLTSDQSPKDLTQLEDRLKTRFSGGLVFDIQPPSMETKIKILQRKAFEKKTVVPEDVLNFIAQDSGDDVRTLEGRLTKVIFASKLHEEPITVALAQSALQESVSEKVEEATPESVIQSVMTYYKLSRADLLGKSRKREVVIPRQICCYLMCDVLNLPLVTIGKIMGGKDHTTVLYARDKVAEIIRLDDKIAKDVDDIKNMILKK